MTCPDENVLVGFVTGTLRTPEAAELDAHLAGCEDCRSLVAAAAGLSSSLSASVDETLGSVSRHTCDARSLLLMPPGTEVDRFRILRPLGRGAAGSVYLAKDSQLGRNVALKFLRPPANEPDMRRVLVEARATALLSHPSIVTIYDVGEYERHPYLALEYVEGRSLRERLAAGPIAAAEALRIFCAIVNALAFAHEHQITHGDLKPENVFLPDASPPRVLDFGLARIPRDDDSVEEPERQEDRSVRGTPAYMAPEQWAGHAGPASDVWALGIVLHEMVTGRRPFETNSVDALHRRVTSTEPLPIDRKALARMAAPDLVGVVQDCLDKEPARRPLARELGRRAAVLGTRSVSSVAGRRRWLVAVSVAAALTVAIGSSATLSRRSAPDGGSDHGSGSVSPRTVPCARAPQAADGHARPAPIQLSAAALSPTRTVLRWRLAPNATSYTVHWGDGPCFVESARRSSTIDASEMAHSGHWDHFHLRPDTTYSYRVTANYGSEHSAPSLEAAATTTPAPLPAPRGLTGTAEPDGTTISWPNVPGAVTYAISIADRPGIDPESTPGALLLAEPPVYVDSAVHTFKDHGAAPGRRRYYRLQAVAGGAAGPPSEEITVVVR